MLDLIIIGAGPAGMSAAIYAKRGNLDVLLLEKGAPGGQVVNTYEIENYPGFLKGSGADLALKMFETVNNLNIRYEYGDCTNILQKEGYFEVLTDMETYQAKKILIASGSSPRKLNVKNEDLLIGKKISFCAVCDGSFYKGKEVVVIGGGNSAVEEAIYLAGICTKVTVIQNLDFLTAEERAIDHLKAKQNVEIRLGTRVSEYNYLKEKDQVEVILDTGDKIITDGVFTFIGLKPNNDFLNELKILNDYGFIKTDENMESKIPGIYAAGDIREKTIRQVVTATNDGAIASLHIKDQLKK